MSIKSKKVLVLGMGQVGLCLRDAQPQNVEAIYLSRAEVDITDETKVQQAIAQHKSDCVINAAAYTAVDKAESEPELAFAVNATGPEYIAKACADNGARLIHISTDFVFDGKKQAPYLPTDETNPLNVYGASKLAGEKAVLANCENSLIVRTSWVYSQYGNNFVKTMLRLMAERDELSIVDDQVGSPTSAVDLAEKLWLLSTCDVTDVEHVCNAGSTSWFGFAQQIFCQAMSIQLLAKPIELVPIASGVYPQAAERPKMSVLASSKVVLEKSPNLDKMPEWQESLVKVLMKLKSKQVSDV